MNNLTEISLHKKLWLASFYIENMYSNVPTDELINIIKFMRSQQNLNDNSTKELILMTCTIMKQNYFEFHNNFYVQNKGLAMGAPTSSILSEIHLQLLKIPEYIQCSFKTISSDISDMLIF